MLPYATHLPDTDFLSGSLLLVDKPKGWTSFDVVNKIRFHLRKKYQQKNIKVGHSGTLDPMATGLLLICTGKWTKDLHQLQGLDKVYHATITLGIETDSYDADGSIVSQREVPSISSTQLDQVLQSFHGTIDQYPPAFSAIKKDGKKLYELARAGKEVKTEARKVTVYDIQVLQFISPNLDIRVHCGSGFYVRSLAHDIGEKMGCGGHLSMLERKKIGPYILEDAWKLDLLIHGLDH